MFLKNRFWISWKDGIISVGTGGSMGRPLVSWPFKVPGTGLNIPFNIQAASFSTGTGEGEWEMDQHYGKLILLRYANSEYFYKSVIGKNKLPD